MGSGSGLKRAECRLHLSSEASAMPIRLNAEILPPLPLPQALGLQTPNNINMLNPEPETLNS